MRRFAVLLLLSTALPVSAAHAERPAGRTAREVHTRGHYPSDLSILPPEPADAERDGFGAHRDRAPVRLYRSGGEDEREPPQTSLPSFALGGVGKLIGVVLVTLCVLALVVVFVFAVMQLRLKRASPDDAADASKPAEAPPLDPLLAMPELSAEELARQGRYREAIHALLVSGLFATGFEPSGRARGSTAREVVAALGEADRRKPPLATLLGETELVWFGGRDATVERYERARALHAEVERGAAR